MQTIETKAYSDTVIAQIARVAHEANRAFCKTIGDFSQLSWDEAPNWQKDSAINGVRFHLHNPEAGPAASHENWMKEKVAAGWKFGPTKNVEAKEHPCMVPYDELPENQRRKDDLFIGIVHALARGR
jgi:hypothetical protein